MQSLLTATECTGLPSPTLSGAQASLIDRGETFGRCLGLRGWEAAPSCPGGGAEVLWEPSSQLNEESRMRRAAYAFRHKKGGELHYLVTFSYQEQFLVDVSIIFSI